MGDKEFSGGLDCGQNMNTSKGQLIVDNDNSHDFDDTSHIYQTAALDPTKQITLSAKRKTGGFYQHPSPIKT